MDFLLILLPIKITIALVSGTIIIAIRASFRLIIRIPKSRELAEISSSNIIKLLPKSNKYEIQTKGDFSSVVKKADLLISYSSTTIMEALHANIPVGLYGYSDKFRYINGNINLPDKNKRSAVYYLNDKNIIQMLTEIKKYHHNKKLTLDELNDYIWKSDVPNITETISKLI